MARPRKFETDDTLEKAMHTFWELGYETTTTEDLEAATGLKRGSLYNAFTNKHGLYMAVLNHYSTVKMAEAIDIVEQAESFLGAAKSLLLYLVEDTRKQDTFRGCLLCDAAVERAPRDPEVAACVRTSIDTLKEALANTDPAYRNTPEGASIAAEAGRIVALYMGLRLHAKIGYPLDEIAAIASREIAHLEQDWARFT